MNQVIECNGGCDYRIKHMNKARLERLGLLPQSNLVTDAAMTWDGSDNDDLDDLDYDDSV